MMMISIPPSDLPILGQRGHSFWRYTAAGTAAPTTTDTGNTVPQHANPTLTAYAHSFPASGMGAMGVIVTDSQNALQAARLLFRTLSRKSRVDPTDNKGKKLPRLKGDISVQYP